MLKKSLSFAAVCLLVGCTASRLNTAQRLDQRHIRYSKAPNWTLNLNQSQQSLLAEIDRLEAQHADPPAKLWAEFQRAQVWQKNSETAEQACRSFTSLSQNRTFPLNDLAALNAVEVCPADSLQVQIDWKSLAEKKWLKEKLLSAKTSYAKKKFNTDLLIEAHLGTSKWQTNKSDKVASTTKALEYAKALGNTERIKSLTQRLYRLAPRLNPQPNTWQKLKAADDHLYYRDFSKARRIYNELIKKKKASNEIKYRAHLGLRRSFKLARDKKRTLQETYRLTSFTKKVSQRSRSFRTKHLKSMLLLTRTVWTQGDPEKATQFLRNTSQYAKKHALNPTQIYWLRGRIDEEANKPLSAIRWFDRALASCKKSCSLKKELLWYKAWNQKRSKQLHEAHKTLTLLTTLLDPDEKSKAYFWNAKILQELGDSSLAKGLFEYAIQHSPFGFYGLLAQRELHAAILPLHKTIPNQVKHSSDKRRTSVFLQTMEGQKAQWLISVGEDKLASRFIAEKTHSLIKDNRDNFAFWDEVLFLYHKSNAHQKVLQTLWKIPQDVRHALILSHPELLFPAPYSQAVQQYAKAQQIPAELVYAIMRQESLFNRKARSPADAFGLMQLIPSLASQLSKRNQVQYSQPSDLYQPETNIALGSAHLKDLWNKYNGQFILAAASYNASEKAIRNWVKHRFTGDPLLFIEDIPYAETRKYVKLVMRNFILYKRLKTQDSYMPFPECNAVALREELKSRDCLDLRVEL